jgi:NAD+ synthase (glutamine-hydrolysing)
MTPELTLLLEELRRADQFDTNKTVQAKVDKLNRYMRQSRLAGCVIAVSGGVDSALVLALAHRASQQAGSPIRRIVPVLLPVHAKDAASNQGVATQRGRELCAALNLLSVEIDLTAAHATTKTLVDEALGVMGGGWASGQLVAYQRTPALYYVTSLMSQIGVPSILVGTTNEDEGAYLGFFGKASDGLTDIQLISDLSKHRVFQLARQLGVPLSILQAVPTGDMYDGRVDEEVFGAPYAFVELYLRAKKAPEALRERVSKLSQESQQRFRVLSHRLDALHRYNQHKYLGRSPAVHLDVQDVRFPGSWNYTVFEAEPPTHG